MITLLELVNSILADVGEVEVTSINSSFLSKQCVQSVKQAFYFVCSDNDWEWMRKEVSTTRWNGNLATIENLISLQGVGWRDTDNTYRPLKWVRRQDFDLIKPQPIKDPYTAPGGTSTTTITIDGDVLFEDEDDPFLTDDDDYLIIESGSSLVVWNSESGEQFTLENGEEILLEDSDTEEENTGTPTTITVTTTSDPINVPGDSFFPLYYTKGEENQIRINPYPSGADGQQKIRFYCYIRPQFPNTGNASFDVPEDIIYSLIKPYALYLFCLSRLDDANTALVYKQMYESNSRTMRMTYRGTSTGSFNMYRRYA